MTGKQHTWPPARLSTRAVVGKGSIPYSSETGWVEPAPGSPSAAMGSRARRLELSNGAVILGVEGSRRVEADLMDEPLGDRGIDLVPRGRWEG